MTKVQREKYGSMTVEILAGNKICGSGNGVGEG
jgi:hypothetical protein